MTSAMMRQLAGELRAIAQEEPGFWPGLSDHSAGDLPKVAANEFFAGAILDFQIKAETAWKNGWRLVYEISDDAEDVWRWIASLSAEDWNERTDEYRLHRFRWAHNRVRRISVDIVANYDGDVRRIWNDGASNDTVLRRLKKIRVGEQLSNMIVGALMDTGHLGSPGDIKADSHACRVIGRLITGSGVRPQRAVELARAVYPTNPWSLDYGLFSTGKELCHTQNPECGCCRLQRYCKSASGVTR